MLEKMGITVEVWPLAADEAGIWLISGGDALRWGPVMADGDVHYETETLLRGFGLDLADVGVIHSTSWRPDGPAVVLTYMAVVKAAGYVLETWPDAAPVTASLPAAVGKAPPHGAAEVPVPRVVDVLLHGLRHLKFLAGPDGDAETAAALDAKWLLHLAPLRPALADDVQRAARRLAPAAIPPFPVHRPFPVAAFALPGRVGAVVHLRPLALAGLPLLRLAPGLRGQRHVGEAVAAAPPVAPAAGHAREGTPPPGAVTTP